MDIKRYIYDFFINNGFTAQGACAIIGNLIAESALKSNNVQDNCPLSDSEYTARVDAGTYAPDVFVNDSFGYGLAQWTYFTRKRDLLEFCRMRSASISDLDSQLSFILYELKQFYLPLSNDLKNPEKSIKDLTESFMVLYEAPYDNSRSAKNYRVKLAEDVSNELCYSFSNYVRPVVPKLRMCDRHCFGFAEFEIITWFLIWLYPQSKIIDPNSDEDVYQAIVKFQSDFGLTTDGVVGPQTWSKIADVLKEGVQN